jgi:acetyl esterase/lipase
MRFFLTLFLSLATIFGAQSVGAQNLTFEDIKKLPAPPPDKRISYGSDASQFGELRLPQTTGKKHPVVIVIHGGCWFSEYDLTHLANFSAALTRAGVATWTLEYRRVGQAGGGWPGTFQDVARGADHLRVLARTYPLDLKRVVAVGHSAGGQLGLWLAARSQVKEGSLFFTPDPLQLRGVVSLAGINDLRKFGAGCNSAVKKLLGGSAEELPERYQQTSPVELLPLGVRQSLIHGALDKIVSPDLSRDYTKAAQARGDNIRLTILEQAGHFDLISPRSAAWPTIEREVLSLLNFKQP